MPTSRIPSPARSQGAAVTPRRYKPRGPRSVGSPARSDVSGRLTSVIHMYKNNSFMLSPMPSRRSVLPDNTDIEEPKCRSWWRQLGENSRDVIEVLENNKVSTETNNIVEDLIEMEVLSQEKKSYNIDLPESSGSESIHSIVMPQRKLFKQKENEPQKIFSQLVGNRETLPKLHKTGSSHDTSVNVGTRHLFQSNKQRTKPIFPAALLDISLNKTAADKSKENIKEAPKNQVRNIFGNRAPTKRRNMFAEFVVSDSEDEIAEIQPKVFGFSKKSDTKRSGSTASRGIREPSPGSSVTTDMEMDDWKLLPSSTLVAEQLEEAVCGTPVKRARLTKLSEAKESEAGTNSIATVDKTKQSNKSISLKNKSKNVSTVKDTSVEMNLSMTTRNTTKAMQNNSQINVTKNTTLNKSLASKTSSNSKSKNSNSSLNKHDSKKLNRSNKKTKQNVSGSKTLNIEGNNQNKQNSNLATLTHSDFGNSENNVQSDDNRDNDEINFTLEYESDDHHETIATNQNNKSVNDKNVTSTKNSIKTLSDASSPEAQNTLVKKLQHISKNIVEGTQKLETLKDQLISTDIKKSDLEIISLHDGVDREIGKQGQTNNSSNIENIVENHDMELNQRELNSHENEIHNRDETEQMEIDEIDEGMRDVEKEIPNKNVSSIQRNREDSKINQDEHNEGRKGEPESHRATQRNDKNDQIAENKDIVNEYDNAQSYSQENKTKNEDVAESQIMQRHSIENDKSIQKPENRENVKNTSELQNKDQDSIVGQKLENNFNQDVQNKNNEGVHNESETEKQDECETIVQHASETVEQTNTEKEKNESEVDHNDSEAEENESKIEHDDSEPEDIESETEEQNRSEVEQDVSEPEEQNESVLEEQDESELEEQDESELEEQNKSILEEQVESEPEEQDENERELEEQNKNVLEEQVESEPEEQNKSEQEDQNESELVEQNESKAERHNENESLYHNESDSEDQNENEEESQNEIQEQHESEVIHTESKEESEDVIERTETPHSSGIKSPEAILHDKTNQVNSFTAHGRNTSVRKSRSMIKPLNVRPSMAPPRESLGFSDGTKNSSAEGSGWDSHRTTRKTLRQTFGKDFSPRKSLRALVMEKSAKRQTVYIEGRSEITTLPQANSTEFPEMSNHDYDEDESMEPSDHEVSKRTRQATLEMCLQEIKKKNMERRQKTEEVVRNMFLKTTTKENNPFKVPARPMFASRRVTKQVNSKPKGKQVGSLMPLDYLPPEMLDDMKYKPPKRFKPSNASWITKRLYKFLENKLETKYDYKARVRAEKLVETIYHFAKEVKRHEVAPTDAVEVLKQEMARLDIVKTHFEFYEFFNDYIPREIRIKVIPDIVNKISMPKHGIFSDILH